MRTETAEMVQGLTIKVEKTLQAIWPTSLSKRGFEGRTHIESFTIVVGRLLILIFFRTF